MSTSVREALAVDVRVEPCFLVVLLKDGRELSVPLGWFPRLERANAADRNNWRVIGNGEGINWPSIEEDISVAGLLRTP